MPRKRTKIEKKKAKLEFSKKKWLENKKKELRKYLLSEGTDPKKVEQIISRINSPKMLRLTKVWSGLIQSAVDRASESNPKTPVEKYLAKLYDIRDDKLLSQTERDEANRKLDELLLIVVDVAKKVAERRKEEDSGEMEND